MTGVLPRLLDPPDVTSTGAMMRWLEMRLSDGTWKRSPVGQEVERFLRAERWAGAAENTVAAKRQVLGLLAARHDDWPSLTDFCSPAGTEYLREFLDAEWGLSSLATKQQRTSIVKSFFRWAALDQRIPYDPAATIRAPRGRTRTDRLAFPIAVLHALVAAQDTLRDQCCIQLLCRLALRKNELRLLAYRDIDVVRGYVLAHGKGGHDELLPVVGSLRDDLVLLRQEHDGSENAYVLAPRGHPEQPMNPSSVHRWFKRCLAKADLPDTIKTHEMRHSAADAIYRRNEDVVMAQLLLRHEDLATTQRYIHPTKRDLAEALLALDEVWRAEREETYR